MNLIMQPVYRLRSARCILAASIMMFGTYCGTARAQALVYSFEFLLDGFGPNGGGIVLNESTIGATEGELSLQVDVASSATFVGALTQFLPSEIGDPPGLDHVLFDLTIEEEFTEGFAVVGITVFGHSQPDYPGGQQFGLQAQFLNDEEPIDGLAPGTYTDMRIDLTSAIHPLTFEPGQSFNDIFGTKGSGPNDIIPSGFQFYFNKTGSPAAHALKVYIDNVRVGTSLTGDFNGDGIYDCDDANALTNAIALGGPVGQFDLNDDDLLSLADMDVWRAVAGEANLGPGRVYPSGDANLDSVVDGSDFGAWNANKFTANANWCDGDLNADGSVDGSDFGVWNAVKFTSGDGAAVPEPVGLFHLFAFTAVIRIWLYRWRDRYGSSACDPIDRASRNCE